MSGNLFSLDFPLQVSRLGVCVSVCVCLRNWDLGQRKSKIAANNGSNLRSIKIVIRAGLLNIFFPFCWVTFCFRELLVAVYFYFYFLGFWTEQIRHAAVSVLVQLGEFRFENWCENGDLTREGRVIFKEGNPLLT